MTSFDPDTAALVDSASRGDAVAVDRLLERYLPGLRAFVRLQAGPMLRARESASDLVQSVCREVLLKIDSFQYGGESGFKRWLYVMATRKIADRQDYWQAAKRDIRRETPLQGHDEAAPDDDLLQCYRTCFTPSRQAMAREELQLVERAFETLRPEQREVILLSRLVGLRHAEIAEQLGRSEQAVRSLLSRSLAELADRLAERP